jgi:hypothetical protein
MAYNPKNAPTGSLNSVSTGKGAGATALASNALNQLSHVVGRRMGIYDSQPLNTPSDGLENWGDGNLSGSYYTTAGTRFSEGRYDSVVANVNLYYGGLVRQQGQKGSTVHYDVRMNYNEAPSQIWTTNYTEGELTQSYSSGQGNPFNTDGNDLSGSIGTVYHYATFQQGAGGPYDAANYNSFLGENGYWQYTTRDLASPEVFLNRTNYATTINGFTGSLTSNADEGSGAAMQGKLTVDVPTNTTTALYGDAVVYVGSFCAYPTDYKSE